MPKPKKPALEAKPALLFDLDGTLVDSLDDLVAAINATMLQCNLRPLSREDVARIIGKGSRVLVEKALLLRDPSTIDPIKIESVHRLYLQQLDDINGRHTHCFEGVTESLAHLKADGFSIALVTNKPRRHTLTLLRQLHLDHFFDVVVAGGDASTLKPAPEMLLLAARALVRNPSDCIMIGDSMNDALAAQNAQMTSILLKTGYNEGVNIDKWAQKYAPDSLVFANIRELVSYLDTQWS